MMVSDYKNNNNSFIDTSTECAICLSPLDDGNDNDNNNNNNDNETITLSCGHRWHLKCLKEQLQNSQPNRSKRLIFSGTRCAKCAVFCDHPKLQNLTQRTDIMRTHVDTLIEEQLKVDFPEAYNTAASDTAAMARLRDEGRRSYAFYLCVGCDQPYFGGTIECADEDEGELTTSEDKLCQSCSPKSQIVCQHTFEHRPFHVWKCRYCCSPSNYVCYGNVHFCTDCHDRNSKRTRHGNRHEGRPKLEAIPCQGENCPFPKPEGCNKHSNGSALECELVYFCIACESSPASLGFTEVPGSRNFICNPNGEEGLNGWQTRYSSQHSRCRWAVEEMEVRVDESINTNFVSSFQWCVMYQKVQLHQYVRDPSMARIEVSAKFMARTDCPSVFRMEVIITNSQGGMVYRQNTSQCQAPADFWEKATLLIEPVADAYDVTMVIYGKDGRFWQGYFGAKVCHCSVRVLGSEEELQNILLPAGKSFILLFPFLHVRAQPCNTFYRAKQYPG